MKKIKNKQELFDEVGVKDEQDLKRVIYNNTECGAWVAVDDEGVEIGSIVEGSEAEFASHIYFPFEKEEFWTTLEWINDEACYAFEEANQELLAQSGEETEDDNFLNFW